MFGFRKAVMPTPDRALPGRDVAIETAERHFLSNRPLKGPYPDGSGEAVFAMGCFWGIERQFWGLPGVWVTMVGYVAGLTPNPTYREICTGQTGHTEAVRVVFDPSVIGYEALLRQFWEGHDPTQGMRQGNDVGTQYRSGIYTVSDAQADAAAATRETFQRRLSAAGHGAITTEIAPLETFYYAEDYHQQYLAKNPGGYCGVGGTGVTCPIGVEA